MNTETVLPILGELLAKSALILLAAALLVKAWRHATAAQRHLVWLTAVAAVLLLPATHFLSPRWSIPLHPAKKITIVLPAEAPASVVPLEAAPLDAPVPVSAPVDAPLDWRRTLLVTWLGCAALLLGYRLFGSWRLHRLWRRSSAPDDPRLRLILARTAVELGLRRLPEVRVSAECRVPITWSTWRPVLVLPQHALEWNDAWLTAALRHEAAHIVRRDALTHWLAQCTCALYWPNPFVWLAARALRLAQEQAADDLVLRAGTPADEYATQLVAAARAVAEHGFLFRQAVAMACPSTLEDRVRSIVDGHRDRRPLSRLAASVGSIAVLLTLAVCTAAQLQGADPAAPAAGKATDPAAAKGPRVVIVARIVELPNSLVAPGGPFSDTAIKPVYAEPEAEALIRLLNQKKGVDLVVVPTVSTPAGQPANIEVCREFRYATDWAKGARDWEPKAFATKNVGVMVEVTPEFKDGTIELHVKPSRTEFEGFVDLDGSNKFPAAKNLTSKRLKPLFSEGKLDTTVTLKSGETAVISGIKQWLDGKKPVEEDPLRRKLIIFLTARIAGADDLVITGNVTINTVITDGTAKLASTPAADAPQTITKTGTGTLVVSGSTDSNTSTGANTITGGTLTISSSTEPAAASTATVRLMSNGERVEITGQSITTEEDGVTTAKGDARLQWAGQDMSAQSIRYNPATRQVDLTGKVTIRNSANVIEADHLTVWLEDQHPGGHLNISGPHKTSVEATPAARPSPKL